MVGISNVDLWQIEAAREIVDRECPESVLAWFPRRHGRVAPV
jgi:hypothetical protein